MVNDFCSGREREDTSFLLCGSKMIFTVLEFLPEELLEALDTADAVKMVYVIWEIFE